MLADSCDRDDGEKWKRDGQLFLRYWGNFAEGTGGKDIKEAIVSRKQAFGQIEYPEVIEKEISHLLPVCKRSDKRVLKGTMGSGAAHGSGSRIYRHHGQTLWPRYADP